jgi:hypothetical protein
MDEEVAKSSLGCGYILRLFLHRKQLADQMHGLARYLRRRFLRLHELPTRVRPTSGTRDGVAGPDPAPDPGDPEPEPDPDPTAGGDPNNSGGDCMYFLLNPCGDNPGPPQEQDPSPNPPDPAKKPDSSWCAGLQLSGAAVAITGGYLMFWGTAADATVVGAPVGLLSQASGAIAAFVGGVAGLIGLAGEKYGACSQ